jgi:hypothetical protein
VVVTSGLTDGERVVTDGQSRIGPGARVRVVSQGGAAAPAPGLAQGGAR